MKTNVKFTNILSRRTGGYALLLLVLILSTASLLILAASMNRTSTVANLNQRSNQFTVLNNAAEAATEEVYALMAQDFSANGPGFVAASLANYRTRYPSATDNPYWSDFLFSDAQGNNSSTYVSFVTNYTGPLPTQYTNQFATTSPIYKIVSNVTMPGSSANIVGTAQKDLMLAMVPITTYAIFYNGELEFSDCATMVVNGRVHSNSDICSGAGSGATLTFNGPVTCCNVIQSPPRGGLTYTFNQGTTYNSGDTTNVVSVQISIPMTNTHSIIDLPPAGESPLSLVGQQREYNRAQVVLVVTNSPLGGGPEVMVTLQTSYNGTPPGNDPYKWTVPVATPLTNVTTTFLITNSTIQLPFLTLNNTFGDQRQGQPNLFVTQIDVGAFNGWALTNSVVRTKLSQALGTYPLILYVADQRYIGTSQQAVVRLVNAQKLPPNATPQGVNLGFTVATENPLYVMGDYNTTIDGVHFALTPGSTTNGWSVPAALISDAVTILSSSWSDAKSNSGYSGRNAVANNMTINAAIITGNIPSSGASATTFSGGVHNLTRMLENWSSVTLTYNTSIICLYTSKMATNQFLMPYSGSNPNGYYTPPTRHWGFDMTFYDPNKQPPGVPCALIPIRYNWLTPPPGSVAMQ
jgi:hypothetical protein